MIYKITIKAEVIGKNGRSKVKNQNYLTEAVSYTDAEAKATKYASEYFKGEFSIHRITPTKYSEIINKECDVAFEVEYNIYDLDTDKKIPVKEIVFEQDYDSCKQLVNQRLTNDLTSNLIGIKETKILGVID